MLLFLVVCLYGDRVLAGDFTDAFDPGDLVLLEEVLDSLRILSADGARAFHGDAEIELDVADGNAEILGVGDSGGQGCRLEQRFRRDAAPKDAGAAEPFALDHCDRHSELRGGNGADVTSRPAAYENHVVRSHLSIS